MRKEIKRPLFVPEVDDVIDTEPGAKFGRNRHIGQEVGLNDSSLSNSADDDHLILLQVFFRSRILRSSESRASSQTTGDAKSRS